MKSIAIPISAVVLSLAPFSWLGAAERIEADLTPPKELAVLSEAETSMVCGLHLSAFAGQTLSMKSERKVSHYVFILARYWRDKAATLDLKRAYQLNAEWERQTSSVLEVQTRYCYVRAAVDVANLKPQDWDRVSKKAMEDLNKAVLRAKESSRFRQ